MFLIIKLKDQILILNGKRNPKKRERKRGPFCRLKAKQESKRNQCFSLKLLLPLLLMPSTLAAVVDVVVELLLLLPRRPWRWRWVFLKFFFF